MEEIIKHTFNKNMRQQIDIKSCNVCCISNYMYKQKKQL